MRTVTDLEDATVSVSGGIRFSIYSPADQPLPALSCGDVLQAEMTLRTPEHYRDPGVWDRSAWLLGQGIGALGSAKAERLSIVSHSIGRRDTSCWMHDVQQRWSHALLAFADRPQRLPQFLTISPEDAGMLSAMVTGDRTYLGRAVRIGFERTGSFHLLVVSGLHLGLFAAFVFQLARFLRAPRVVCTVVTLALASGYALLTGFGQPVQRALAMLALYLVGRLLFRERSGLNAIGFAALCLLAASPKSLFDTGLQMTLLSVIAIAGIVTPLLERTLSPYLQATRDIHVIALDSALPPVIAQFRVTLRLIAAHVAPLVSFGQGGKRSSYRAMAVLAAVVRLVLRATEVVLVSAVIELAMALPMATYFHRVTVFGLPVNVLIIPALALLLPLACITLLALLAAPGLVAVPAALTAGVLHIVTSIVHRFSTVAGSDFRVPAPGLNLACCSLVLLALSITLVRRERFGLLSGPVALALAAAVVLLPSPIAGHIAGHKDALEVTALDVGQGDALLVVSPSGKTLLVDAGGHAGGPAGNLNNFDVGEDVVSPYLWSRHIRRLDAVALTHAHSDHMGGMPAVLRNFRPRELWVGANPDIPDYDALLAEARDLGIQVRRFSAGDRFTFGQTDVHVLAPAGDYQPGAKASNNDSLVLHMAFGNTSALLEGDAETPSEGRMLGEPGLHADLLKIGHHGSKTSTIPPFLQAVAPRFAVISVGLHNSYHHPRWETLEHLQEQGVRTYRTDLLGFSSFYLDGRVVTPANP